jgi:hypothetical protein
MEQEMEKITRDIPNLELRAAFVASSVNDEKRTVDVTWTTGAKVLRGWYDKFWEELSLDPAHVRMERLQSGRAPLLGSHDSYSLGGVIGVVERANVSGKVGTATVRFARAEDSPEADRIFRLVKDGIISNVSVGYSVIRFEKTEDVSEKIPTYRAVDWEPYELSLVAIGADAGSSTRSMNEKLSPCEFVSRALEADMPGTTNETQPASTPTTPSPDIAERAMLTERERVSEINKLVKMANIERSVGDGMIERGLTIPEVKDVILKTLAERTAQPPGGTIGPPMERGEDDSDKFRRAAVASLIVRSGAAETVTRALSVERARRDMGEVSLDCGEMRRLSFVDLARECIERKGIRTRGMDAWKIVDLAIRASTASDFPIILGTSMNKMMLAEYETQPDEWRSFCGVKTVTDFRAHDFYRNGSFGVLDEINEHGELKSKSIPDGEKLSATIRSFGNKTSVTRKVIVNDDMGAFLDVAMRFGRMSGLSLQSSVFALLALNSGLGPTIGGVSPFFDDALRKNVGTGSALSVEGIDADRVKMAYQKDHSGNLIQLRPSVLLLPVGLEGTAKIINGDAFDPDSVKLQRTNKVRGLYSVIIGSAWLAAGSTRRYSFSDPSRNPAIVVLTLAGYETPRFEQVEDPSIDGVVFRQRFDYEVKEFDPRAAVTNAGAA